MEVRPASNLFTKTGSFLAPSITNRQPLSWNITTKLLSYSLPKLGKQMLKMETKIPRGRGKKMVVSSESTSSIASYSQEIVLYLVDILGPDSQHQKQWSPCLMLLADSLRYTQNCSELWFILSVTSVLPQINKMERKSKESWFPSHRNKSTML